jgi:hypothetical protein
MADLGMPWTNPGRNRTPLSDQRMDEIVAEVEAAMIAAEDASMAERMAGLRCMSCECPLPGRLVTSDEPSSGTRRCRRCEGMI